VITLLLGDVGSERLILVAGTLLATLEPLFPFDTRVSDVLSLFKRTTSAFFTRCEDVSLSATDTFVATTARDVIWVTLVALLPLTAVSVGVAVRALGVEGLIDLLVAFALLCGDFAPIRATVAAVLVFVAEAFGAIAFDDFEPDDFDFKAFPLQWDGWLLATAVNRYDRTSRVPRVYRNLVWSLNRSATGARRSSDAIYPLPPWLEDTAFAPCSSNSGTGRQTL